MKQSGARATVEALRRENVRCVFGLPGTTIMHLLDELAGQEEIRYISTRHEQTAAFMADGYARGSGEVGVCMASRGPGAANMAIGMHNAHAESIPVVSLVGQVADDIYYREAFEEMDLVKFFEPVSKWSIEVHNTPRIPELVQRAVRTAAGGRPRPVSVSLPLDVQLRDIEEPVFQDRFRHLAPEPPLSELREAAQLLERAERPLMIVGGGSLASGAAQAARTLAESLNVPVATTWLRKDAFPNRHEMFVGTLGFGSTEVTDELVKEADVLLAVGCRFSEFTTKRWTLVSPQTRIIHLDIDPEEIGRIYPPEIGLQGDARRGLEALNGVLADTDIDQRRLRGRQSRLESLRPLYRKQTKLPASETTEASSGVPSEVVIRVLQEVLDQEETVLVQDTATFGVWMQRFLSFDRPGSLYAAAGGSMGWGLPAAMGLKLASPEQRVINVSGDASFWMVAQDLETAVREDIPIVNLITNNFAYGNTRDRQSSAHDKRYFGVFYDNPDFARYAELLGAHGERVTRPEELRDALERAMRSGKPAVIDVVQDRFEGLPADLAPLQAR